MSGVPIPTIVTSQDPAIFTAPPASERNTIVLKKEQKLIKTNLIPDEILHDEFLNDLIRKGLPKNYNFEIHKTIWKIKLTNSRRVLLQLPEGLIRFGPIIVDILKGYFKHEENNPEEPINFITMGDLTYGACCIDDYLAASMACDLIVHYAHSCLVPINQLNTSVKYLYIFLDIKFDLEHVLASIKHNFKPDTHKIAIASTIQFVASIHEVARELKKEDFSITLPQSRPLSMGETLGCTASKLDPENVNTIIFICDGRFHLEALMIANPKIPAYRYDPYSRKLTHESYAYDKMYKQRLNAIDKSVKAMERNGTFGFILGTLGRQGNEQVYDKMVEKLRSKTNCNYLMVMMPEVVQDTLKTFPGVDVWVQVACPRLSIDWGNFFERPLLNPFEFAESIKIFGKQASLIEQKIYPMDFYAKNSCGDHTPNHCCQNNSNCLCDNK